MARTRPPLAHESLHGRLNTPWVRPPGHEPAYAPALNPGGPPTETFAACRR